MKIVVNNLTRMKGAHICIAGIHVATGKHVRPIIADTRFDRTFLRSNGGAFDIGAIVKLGNEVYAIGTRPEIEDHSVIEANISFVEIMEDEKFWKTLKDPWPMTCMIFLAMISSGSARDTQ
jgi:hypothetical protein